MLLLLHITIALVSLILATITFIAPSTTKLRTSTAFIGLTLASGVALVFASPAVLLHVCVSGIVYVSLATVAVVFARRKLATVK